MRYDIDRPATCWPLVRCGVIEWSGVVNIN